MIKNDKPEKKGIFDFLKRFFPVRAKTFDEFVEITQREGCQQIAVEPKQTAKNAAETYSVGMIADWQHVLLHTATTTHGQKVTFLEFLFERTGSDSGIGDAEERRDAAIRHFLLAEKKVKELATKLPCDHVDLLGPNGVMNSKDYQQLHFDARKFKVKI
jgi:hypothetical protein